MVTRTAQLSIDLTGVQTHWTAARTALGQVKPLLDAVADVVGTIGFTAAVDAQAGTVAFTADTALLALRLQTLADKVGEAATALDACHTQLLAGLPVTVEAVT